MEHKNFLLLWKSYSSIPNCYVSPLTIEYVLTVNAFVFLLKQYLTCIFLFNLVFSCSIHCLVVIPNKHNRSRLFSVFECTSCTQLMNTPANPCKHYSEVIMGAMTSQITGVSIVYSTVFIRRRWKNTSKLHVTGLCDGISPVTGEFPAQRASNAENVSIWWRHHECRTLPIFTSVTRLLEKENG